MSFNMFEKNPNQQKPRNFTSTVRNPLINPLILLGKTFFFLLCVFCFKHLYCIPFCFSDILGAETEFKSRNRWTSTRTFSIAGCTQTKASRDKSSTPRRAEWIRRANWRTWESVTARSLLPHAFFFISCTFD